MRQVIDELQRIRRRGHAMLLAQRLALLLAWVAGVTLGLIALDFVLRLPATARLVLLAGGLAALGWGIWTYLRPAVRFRPGLTDLALRVEGILPAVAGRLASSVEFAAAGVDRANPLAARSVADTEKRLSGEQLGRVLSVRRTVRALAIFVAVGGVVGTSVALEPVAAQTGLQRIFVPYGGARWPARTAVVSLMDEVVPASRVHPRGQALALRAQVTRGQPDHVIARYRLRADDRYGPWRRIVLTDQGDGIHERLVDTGAEAIELYFETSDARTGRERIKLAAPPAVQRAVLHVTPPSYAAPWFSALQADLGPGLDERAATETPSLIGSRVELRLQLNKPIPVPDDPADLRRALGWDEGEPPQLLVDANATNLWKLRWRLAGTRTLALRLVDAYGLENTEPIAYRIEAVEDRLPTVTIMEPESDEPVLATAVIPVRAEARDDVAVARLGLEAAVEGATGDEATDTPLWATSRDAHDPSGTIADELDLGALALDEGDVVLVRGVAADVFELDGRRHPEVRSAARRLRIISELELAQRFRRELSVVRQNAIRIEARQSELEDEVIDEGVQPGLERAQAQIAERVAGQRRAIDRVGDRMAVNRLDDDQLRALLQQAGDMLDFAGRAANRAAEAVEARRREGAAAPPPDAAEPEPDEEAQPEPEDPLQAPELREPAEADRPIVEAQEEVRQELADLIALLDRDEDTWVATRRLEELLESQTELEAQTAAAGRRTLGRPFEELTPGERNELERMAQQQRDLADRSRQALEELRRRARELDEVDPQGAAGMRNAAESGEQRELVREMDNAAERVEENQMRTARGAQQSARQTLERMLEDMRETRRASAQELLRRLASLIESIERLIRVQETELAALDRAAEGAGLEGRDRAMIRLSQNTRAVAADARAAGQESRRIARLLDRAADAQGAAVIALRAAPIEAAAAAAAEERSLELLVEARDVARELEQTVEQRELMRQRAEIVEAYRRLAEQQVALRSETLELGERGRLDRRGLIEARGLGRRQDEIRVGLSDLRATTSEIRDSAVFSHVHDVIDRLSRRVTDALTDGDAGAEATDRQLRIADSIGRLIEALEDLIQPPEEFARGGGGGAGQGGGGGAPPVIPPVAELMLLRGMQEQVYNQTQDVDRRADLDDSRRRLRLDELGRQQRELLELGEDMAEALRTPPPGDGSAPEPRIEDRP